MEEHKLLDILIHFRTLMVTTDKINKLDPTVTFTDDFLIKRQVYLDKLMFLLNEIDGTSPNDNIDEQNQQPDELSNKLTSMANLLGGEKIVESGDINPAVFDNFGSGLARLLGGGLARPNDANVIQQPQPQPQESQQQPQHIQIQLPINENLKKNELSFNIIKKKSNGIN